MQLKIDRIILHNFKGITHENLLFNNSNVIVSGANGSGKSSVMAAWLWLMSDCNENLVSNPNIFPIDAEEVTPSVEAICSIDGKTVTLERRIKRTVKKSKIEGVNDSVSFSSTYVVNGCEYGLRDFHKKLEEYGITDRFLTLSHPDMFLSGKKDEMRKTLFGMAQAKTDYEIACMEDNTSDVAKLLKDYTFTEVEGMQKSSLRKIAEVYGKDGELLRSKIEGLEMSKVDIDFAELELLKNGITEKLEKNAETQRVGNLIENELTELRKKDMELQFELSGIKQKEQTEKDESERKLRQNRREVEEKVDLLNRNIRRTQDEVELYETSIKRYEAADKNLKENYKQAQGSSFDENSLICPTCGQLLQFDKQETIRADFEKQKKIKIEQAEIAIKENASLLAIKKSELADLNKELEKMKEDKASTETVLKQPLNALQGNMEEPNPYADEKARLEQAIADNQKAIEDKKAMMPNMSVLKAEETELRGQLKDCEIQLSKASDNARIDDMIADLREQQKKYEQDKANSEKILYELELVSKRKNELLTEEINSHFELVKFKMFDWQKNGGYKEVCVPQYQGKDLGVATNTGLEIRMKLDIIRGLQGYYGEKYPVFVDGAEALDETSMSQIQMDCQIVFLKVAERKELNVSEIS